MSNESTALATRPSGGEIVNLKIAEMFCRSGMFPGIRDVAQAYVKIQAGAELGITPFAAMRGVHIIQGQATLGVHLMAAKIKASGKYDYRVIEQSERACRIEWFEQGKPIGESAFTWDEAVKAGLTGKDNWRKYPSDMLYARCLSRGARRYCPDALNGAVYTPEEMGAEVDDTGAVVEKPHQPIADLNAELEAAAPAPAAPAPPAQALPPAGAVEGELIGLDAAGVEAEPPVEGELVEPDTSGAKAKPPADGDGIPADITLDWFKAWGKRHGADGEAVSRHVKLHGGKGRDFAAWFNGAPMEKRYEWACAIRDGQFKAKGGA